MWLDPFFTNKLLQDIIATIVTLAASLVWLRAVDWLAHTGRLEQKLSRKVIHTGTGPLFVACWNMFSASPWARYSAAIVPLLITAQFAAVGMGIVQDEAAVKAMTRTGDRREVLRGPLLYGIVFVICTVVYWRNSPIGILALMLMCGGDGLADIVGRRLGQRAKLPFNKDKSWAGSAAMFAGGLVFSLVYIFWFSAAGYFSVPLQTGTVALFVAFICLAAAVVEALPIPDIDNLSITAVALLLGQFLL